ncbi:protein neuralized-like [Tubulanus polymorphus]|uniref:protein neuralized-like n=1 Tax=Tubulanus polymorphus TaxID=672921 RepID=UPI003DA3A4B9
MGNAHQSARGDIMQNTGPQAAMYFHDNHSDNIAVEGTRKRARRIDSFCKGICFGSRPVQPGEKIYVRFADISTSWSGVLRFGYTSHDPQSINSRTLPRYACPDLTSKSGYWCKALGERFAEVGNVVFFYIQRNGDVMYGVNGEEKGVFFSGVNSNLTVWPLVDVYGNTIAVEFCDGPQVINTDIGIGPTLPLSTPNNVRPKSTERVSNPNLPVRYHTITGSLLFNDFHGRNIQISDDKRYATRKPEEYCNAYGFTARPIRWGEKMVIQIQGIDRSFVGGLAFGLTSCNPASIDSDSLPDDADLLLDRREYWVVNKNLCVNPELGDELTIKVADTGEVYYGRNDKDLNCLMHVDTTLPLWAFFDLYGNITKVKSLGVCGETQRSPGQMSQPTPSISGQAGTVSDSGSNGDKDSKECVICYENITDTVLYACGHMCICSSCAGTLRKQRNPLCPICRQPVKDVIKIYRS